MPKTVAHSARALTIALVASFAAACPLEEPDCVNDSDCSDGVFCNGAESCQARNGVRVCVNGDALDCSSSFGGCGACNEISRSCVLSPTSDTDDDGHISVLCDGQGGDDCDDTDPSNYPGGTEVCDGDDNDCNPTTFGPDVDGDGFESTACCNLGACGVDCDDTRPTISPEGVESCNGADDDCNGTVDDGVSVSLFVDSDGDGYGVPGTAVVGCPGQPGFSTLDNDCDDDNAAITPGSMVCVAAAPSQVEVCSEDGVFAAQTCPFQQTCRPQVNGTGFCF